MNAPVIPLAHRTSETENTPLLDLLVVGGGINGTGIANDAAGRGLSVLLCEQGDLAGATSSASSKLIHGGLRYLEHYEFRLVREALAERETLLGKAPHLIKPMRFILPHRPHLRPAWMIRIGMFLYDHLAARDRLAGSTALHLDENDPHNPLRADIHTGFEYSDCWVDDARLVIANAQQAQSLGAQILVGHRCIAAQRHDGHWLVTLEDSGSGQRRQFRARALVNAAGPWAQSFIEEGLQAKSPRHVRLVKGSHFVVPRLHENEQAYILQNEDQRIVFVIPYNRYFSVIGTTDKEYHGDPSLVAMDDEEERYLLDVVNRHFRRQISSEDIVWRYSGVRPLCDDESDSPSAITRDYTLELQADPQRQAPLLSIFGGKLTTYRKLAEAALLALAPWFPTMREPWTDASPLPGGNIDNFSIWQQVQAQRWPWMPHDMLERLCNAYGTNIDKVIGNAHSLADLGECAGAHLYEAEIRYLVQQEWARTADDILWRRSKLGLFAGKAGKIALEALLGRKRDIWLQERQASVPTEAKALDRA